MLLLFRGCRSVTVGRNIVPLIHHALALVFSTTKLLAYRIYIYTITFCQNFLTQLKSGIFTIKIGVIFLYKNLFFFARLNRFLYFWVFKCQIQPVGSLITRYLYAGFYCISILPTWWLPCLNIDIRVFVLEIIGNRFWLVLY